MIDNALDKQTPYGSSVASAGSLTPTKENKMRILILTFMLFTKIVPAFSQVNLSSGLVAYYPFNGNAQDESGNGNNGTVNGATLITDRFGNTNAAYFFSGNDDINKMKIKILDNLGREVWVSEMIEEDSNWKKEIEITGKGLYFVTAQIGNEMYYKRVIITDEK